MVAKTVLEMTSRSKIVTVNPAQVPMSWDRNYSQFSFINLVIYFQLTVVGLPGVIGHHVPKHVDLEYEQESRLLLRTLAYVLVNNRRLRLVIWESVKVSSHLALFPKI